MIGGETIKLLLRHERDNAKNKHYHVVINSQIDSISSQIEADEKEIAALKDGEQSAFNLETIRLIEGALVNNKKALADLGKRKELGLDVGGDIPAISLIIDRINAGKTTQDDLLHIKKIVDDEIKRLEWWIAKKETEIKEFVSSAVVMEEFGADYGTERGTAKALVTAHRREIRVSKNKINDYLCENDKNDK